LNFGAILRDCRERAGISQEKLAEMLHRSRSCISKLENDKKVLDVPTLIQWAEATNAKEMMVAMLCGVDSLALMQSIMTLIGGFVLWA